MRTLLIVLTVVEIVVFVGALAVYLIAIARSLRRISQSLGKVTFGGEGHRDAVRVGGSLGHEDQRATHRHRRCARRRVGQGRASGRRIVSTQAASPKSGALAALYWRSEILQVMYWLRGEGSAMWSTRG